jgi:hypothetical protein
MHRFLQSYQGRICYKLSDKPDNSDNSDKSDKPENSDKSDKLDKPEKSDKSENNECYYSDFLAFLIFLTL